MFGMIKTSDLFPVCTSVVQTFVGMAALQEETRCEALAGLKIIANLFEPASYLDGSKYIFLRPKKKRSHHDQKGRRLQGQVVTAGILNCRLLSTRK